jgi:serine/threonine protein kinase
VHSAKRLHLAVAPDSVFIVESQGKPEVKIANPLDMPGHIEGRDFSQSKAPEAEKDEKSDVWSCGIVLFFLLSCELPYSPEAYINSSPQNINHVSLFRIIGSISAPKRNP